MDNNQMPAGLAMALAQNTTALDAFANLDKQARMDIISRAKNVSSREEMRKLVSSIGSNNQMY